MLIYDSAVLDLNASDFDFLSSHKVWFATDRCRDRSWGEAGDYGKREEGGNPRVCEQVELSAAGIAYYEKHGNIKTACAHSEET